MWDNIAQQYLSILGSILLGIGAMLIDWLRNLYRPRYNMRHLYRPRYNKYRVQYKWIVILVISASIIGGLILCAIGGKLIFIGGMLGMAVGWILSRWIL